MYKSLKFWREKGKKNYKKGFHVSAFPPSSWFVTCLKEDMIGVFIFLFLKSVVKNIFLSKSASQE